MEREPREGCESDIGVMLLSDDRGRALPDIGVVECLKMEGDDEDEDDDEDGRARGVDEPERSSLGVVDLEEKAEEKEDEERGSVVLSASE